MPTYGVNTLLRRTPLRDVKLLMADTGNLVLDGLKGFRKVTFEGCK